MELTLPVSLSGWLLFGILCAVIGITALSFKPIVAYIKANANAKVFDVIRRWARQHVAALEQDPTLKGLASEAKKQQAIIWLVNKAVELNIPLTVEDASNFVEEAVYMIKKVALPELGEALD